MHEGETESRAIYGEAKLDDAKKLIEDGVPVAPLPFCKQKYLLYNVFILAASVV